MKNKTLKRGGQGRYVDEIFSDVVGKLLCIGAGKHLGYCAVV